MMLRVVTVRYDHEPGSGWSAESDEAPGFIVYDEEFEVARKAAHQGLRLYFEGEAVVIIDPTLAPINGTNGGTGMGARPAAVQGTATVLPLAS